LGHHIHGEIWATNIKEVLKENQLLDRPIRDQCKHAQCNEFYFCYRSLKTKFKDKSDFFIYEELSKSGAHEVRNQVTAVALKQGMISLPDTSGTNIDVQILIHKIDWAKSSFPKANTGDKSRY
jgi:hypothetical protein